MSPSNSPIRQPALEPYNVIAEPHQPSFIRTHRFRGSRADGIRYERKITDKLGGEIPGFVPAQWFSFHEGEDSKRRWCQVDGFSFDCQRGTLSVYEIKLRHTHDSWWQLTQLYRPVLQAFFPSTVWTYRLIEICRWYDPSTYYPVKTTLLATLAQSFTGIGVHICKL